jgi:hypothetical protein
VHVPHKLHKFIRNTVANWTGCALLGPPCDILNCCILQRVSKSVRTLCNNLRCHSGRTWFVLVHLECWFRFLLSWMVRDLQRPLHHTRPPSAPPTNPTRSAAAVALHLCCPQNPTGVFFSQATLDCQFVPMPLMVGCLTSGLPRVLLPNCSRVARWPHRCTYPCKYSCNSALLWYRGGPTKKFSVSTLPGPARSAAAPFCFRLFRNRLTKRKGGSRNDLQATRQAHMRHRGSWNM